MVVEQEIRAKSEKTSQKDLEDFLKDLEKTYQRVQEKFGPPLERRERIDAEFFGYIYRCPRSKREANFNKYRLELQNLEAPLPIPRKITLMQEQESLEIVSVSFRWDNKIESHDIFLKIATEKGKLSSLERRTRPNGIIKDPQNPDPDSKDYNQLMIVNIDYEKNQLKMTLGYLSFTGERVSFIYPGNNGPRSPKKTFKDKVVPKPPLENIVKRFQKIEEELLS
jgi:hypothetical protein